MRLSKELLANVLVSLGSATRIGEGLVACALSKRGVFTIAISDTQHQLRNIRYSAYL